MVTHIVFIGKVDCRFGLSGKHQHARLPARNLASQSALEYRHGSAALTLGFCREQIGQAFDLSQVEPTVREGAAREFSGLCRLQAVERRQSALDRVDDCPPAVKVQFYQIVTRCCCWRTHPQDERLIQGPGSMVAVQRAKRSKAWWG